MGVAPSVAPLLALYPASTSSLGNGLGNTTTVANQIIHEDYVLGRADYVISDKDSLFFRYVSDIAQVNSPTAVPLWPVNDHNHNQFSTPRNATSFRQRF